MQKLLLVGARQLMGLGLMGLLASCTHLAPFGADLGKQMTKKGEVRAPYQTRIRYYGWVQPGSDPDEIREGKKMHYLYVWVPANTPEIGVRMVSPARLAGRPDKRVDFVDPMCSSHKSTSIYFDTWVRFERCLAAVSPEDVAKPCAQWVSFGDNDDSDELPANPSGQRYNSVLRIASNADDPLKVLVRGMYRIAFTSYKLGDVQGTFAVELGSVNELVGAAIARTPAQLATLVAERTVMMSTHTTQGVQTAEDDTTAGTQTPEVSPENDNMPTWEQ